MLINKRKISIIAMFMFIFTIMPTNFVHAMENISITSKVIATKEQAKQWATEQGATEKFVDLADLYWELSKDHGNINPAMAYIQAGIESDFGRIIDDFNETYKNPCCMNKSSKLYNMDNDDNRLYAFKSWRDGVSAHLDHLALIAGVKGYPKNVNETTDPNHSKEFSINTKNAKHIFSTMRLDNRYGDDIISRYEDFNIIPRPTNSKMNLEKVEVSGNTLKVSGWALHKEGTLTITATLNGRNLGNLDLGIARADVDRAFPGYPDGERSGFKKEFNIANFPSGKYKLEVDVWGNDGTRISQEINVKIKRTNLPKMNLEFPKANAVVEGNTLNIVGWAINAAEISNIKVLLNNEQIGVANYGLIRRPDVKRAFSKYPNAEIAGFNGSFDMGYVTEGEKTLTVQAIGRDGTIDIRSIKINLKKKPAKMNLETPKWGASINNGYLDINGWALHGSGVKSIKIYADDKYLGYAKIEIKRADVNKAFPGYPNGENSGFSARFKVDDIGVGEKVIKAEAIAWDGSAVVRTAKVKLNKKAAKMNLESPTNGLALDGLKLKTVGWAINDSGIKEVKIYVDNELLGNAVLKQERKDVGRIFSAYTDANNSGFIGEFSVAKFSEGNHKVKAVAIGKDGTSTSMEKTIKIKKRVIVIDANHNIKSTHGVDLGEKAIHNGKEYRQADFNMQFAVALKNKLSNLGYKVVLTQDPSQVANEDDFDNVLDRRLNVVKKEKADLFISIDYKVDMGGDKAKNGIEVGFSETRFGDNRFNLKKQSKKLSDDIRSSLANLGKVSEANDQIRMPFLLRAVDMPSVIIRPGFLSNGEDVKKATDKKYEEALVNNISKTIDKGMKEF